MSVIIISLVSLCVIDAQVDWGLCPDGPSPPVLDPKWRPVPLRFEMITELILETDVVELSQSFSPVRDAVMMDSRIGPVKFYWNFVTNEQFEVLSTSVNQRVIPLCLRQVIQSTSETSVILPRTLLLKPSILLGFDPRNQVNALWGIRYDGDQDLRGIPTNRFKSCFYLNDIRATVVATYYVSDVTKFQAYLPQNTSIILEIDVRIRNQVGHEESYQYNVFRYTPNPYREGQQQALETPAGVYCPNRTSTLDVPTNLPNRASTNSELFIPQANSSIFSSRSLYDTEYQFSRYDVWYPDPSGGAQWLHYTEIHDFATGLNYNYNGITHQCIVRNITLDANDAVMVDGKPDLVQMSSTEHLFSMDDMSYQYTGEKPCRDGVWCHVWIGEKLLTSGTVQHREWYWASRVNGETLTNWIPMKTITKNYVNNSISLTAEITIFNFQRDSDMFSEIDQTMADCYHAMGPENDFNLGIILFTIANDNKYPVHQNMNYLRYTIWQTLTISLLVRPVRISHIIIDHDGKDLLVTFTLLDAPPRYGPVEVPLKEVSLRTTIERLRTVIDANGLAFRAKYDAKEVILRARNSSLQVIYTSFDQNATQCVNQTVAPSQTSTVYPDTTTVQSQTSTVYPDTTTVQSQTSTVYPDTTTVQSQTSTVCPDTTTVQSQNLDQNIDIAYKSSGPLITGFWIGFIILGFFIGITGGFFALKRFSKQ